MNDASPDPRLPVPNKPGGFLPRIAYKPPADHASEPEEKKAETPKSKSRTKPAAAEPADSEDAPKSVLKEATPELDTYETRRRIRLIVGAIMVGAVLTFAGVLIALATQSEPRPPAEEIDAAPNGPDPRAEIVRRDNAARELLAEARLYAKKGQDEQATQRLKRLVDSYPNSTTSNDARDALDRHARRQPLFPDRPIANAQPKVEPKPAEEKPAEVKATPAVDNTPKTTPPETKIATVKPPEVEPEPYRDTALPRPRDDVAMLSLPQGFRPRDEAGIDPSGWPNEITTDRDGSPMVLVPRGEFVMGRRQGRPAERPEHRVMLSTYYVDQHEVTERQFNRFLEATGKEPRKLGDSGDRPVVQVTLEEAKAYAQWAGKSLPTEAQWEKAARSTDGRVFPWGAPKPDWDPPRAPRQLDDVCSYRLDLSPYGAFDMSGNAWEWTADWFEARAYQGRSGVVTDPIGPAKPGGRIPEVTVRGGSSEWDVAWRSGMRVDARLPYLGFRCVLQVEQPHPSQQPATPQQNRGQPGKNQQKVIPF
jgi:formylglycine-generating enzyme required for sulfatase activity